MTGLPSPDRRRPNFIALPYPPSVNRIWRSRTGHNGKPSFYLDRRYETWKRAADNEAMAQKPLPKIAGRFRATIILDDRRRRSNADADNRVKAVLDWLQRVEAIANDSMADSVAVEWGYAPEGCRVYLAEPDAARRRQMPLVFEGAA